MTQQLTHEEARRQAKVIVDQMTIDEKIGQIKYEAPAIDRLNIPEYNYWNEALHGVARAGVATVFPQAIGLAATFDDHLINEIADVIGTEGRAKYNEFTKHEDRDIYKGLTFWSPNVNIFRDPRWGRGHETYGEDPFLTSKFGVAFIKGLQGQAKYLKLAATAKHFAVHSGPEGLRHGFDAVVSDKDLYETYLPAFKAAVEEADVESIMTAYNAVDGVPASVSEMLLKEILHDKWSFEGHVVSDYMAPEDVHENHKYTKDAAETMGLAIKAGLNLVAGHIEQSLHEALDRGLVTEEEITNAVISLYATRVRLGMFATDNEYDAIPYEANDTKAHNNLSEIAAEKSFVLLKNDGVLPLHKETMEAIAVVGPNAHSEIALLGNYFGTPSRSYTILEGIQERLGDDVRVHYSIGSGLFQDHAAEPLAKADERESEAVIAAEHSDVVVAVLGLDSTIEGEEGDAGNSQGAGDKPNLSLPGRQRQLLERLLAVGKPVVVLLASGSSLQLDGLENHPNLRAIRQIWYPGARGGLAVADVLFGAVSPSGKLPVTFYKNVDNLPAFEDYNMAGRTYRYMTDEALYPFGYGLTYSSVELSDLQVKSYEDTATVTATIQNTGNFDTDEVVQVYVKDLGSEFAVPNAQLKGFKRVYLGKGAKQTITFDLRPQDFEVFDAQGRNFIDSDRFEISVGVSQPDSRSVALTGVQPLQTELSLAGSQTMH
ncbi:glycoside hydrolase family 3 C-terminal domain-containing protein [Weissella confusa]|uniref:glycoside hydrolase family 3 C-terminal domain-containing protein n=1 Tax=Weissella confusa TaxID=1583 RepID=UPI0016802742|nr:glycoside hydrolase family 3 C-terminal domain-containing protein [Weissella confusa]